MRLLRGGGLQQLRGRIGAHLEGPALRGLERLDQVRVVAAGMDRVQGVPVHRHGPAGVRLAGIDRRANHQLHDLLPVEPGREGLADPPDRVLQLAALALELLDVGGQLVGHRVELPAQGGELVVPVGRHRMLEVALGEPLGGARAARRSGAAERARRRRTWRAPAAGRRAGSRRSAGGCRRSSPSGRRPRRTPRARPARPPPAGSPAGGPDSRCRPTRTPVSRPAAPAPAHRRWRRAAPPRRAPRPPGPSGAARPGRTRGGSVTETESAPIGSPSGPVNRRLAGATPWPAVAISRPVGSPRAMDVTPFSARSSCLTRTAAASRSPAVTAVRRPASPATRLSAPRASLRSVVVDGQRRADPGGDPGVRLAGLARRRQPQEHQGEGDHRDDHDQREEDPQASAEAHSAITLKTRLPRAFRRRSRPG